jgi:plastocyanin
VRRRYVAAAAAVVMLVVAGAAFAATRAGGPLVKTPGKETWKTNQLVQDTRHFAPATITVPSGGTVTFRDSVGDEPHTVTISTKSDLPNSFNGPCKPCEIASKHLKNPNSQNSPVAHWVLNKGPEGFDEEGDSLALAPKGPHKSGSVVISAPAGTTLYYMGAIHPWMQGKIVVT